MRMYSFEARTLRTSETTWQCTPGGRTVPVTTMRRPAEGKPITQRDTIPRTASPTSGENVCDELGKDRNFGILLSSCVPHEIRWERESQLVCLGELPVGFALETNCKTPPLDVYNQSGEKEKLLRAKTLNTRSPRPGCFSVVEETYAGSPQSSRGKETRNEQRRECRCLKVGDALRTTCVRERGPYK